MGSASSSPASGASTITGGRSIGGVAPPLASKRAGSLPLTVSFSGPSSSSPGFAPATLLLLTSQGPQLEPN